jgi:hypothetical protein
MTRICHLYILILQEQSLRSRGRDSSVGIATRYGFDGSGSIPGSARISLLCGPTETHIQWAPGRETDHSSPSSAEVKSGGVVPLPPHPYSWHRDNFP